MKAPFKDHPLARPPLRPSPREEGFPVGRAGADEVELAVGGEPAESFADPTPLPVLPVIPPGTFSCDHGSYLT